MIETDVLVVGAGPAGLAAALALKRGGFSGRVIVLEKARAVGNHVLSGAVIDPSGFEGLLTADEIAKLPVEAHVTKESFRFLTGFGAGWRIPWVPPMMRARGYPVGSLTKCVRYLAELAQDAGAEVYPGFPVVELIERDGMVVGARTGEKGVDSQGRRKSNYLVKEEIRARMTLLAEGAAGILTERLIAKYGLMGARPQSYALGIKELIELPEPKTGSGGEIMHTFGYPVNMTTYGGGFVYHVSDSQVMVGYAVGLDYADAELNPHELFRRFKATKAVQRHIAGGKAVAYGAKVIPEGGFYALPRPSVPGCLILGDGAGLLDGLRIKGVHLALQSGRVAAEAILAGGDVACEYERRLRQTKGYAEVRRVRNVHGGFTYHSLVGVMMAGFAWITFGRFPFWMVGRRHRDSQTLKRLRKDVSADQLSTPSPLFPDRLTDVFLSGTVHEENQPSHVRIIDAKRCEMCGKRYGRPCTRFCPAEVYRSEAGLVRVDFSNCLHCKTCQIKCPLENVEWNFPQGGDGPRYTRM